MPAESKSQRRTMGWALACKRGETKNCPPNIMKIANSMSEKDLEKYASANEKGLPSEVKEGLDYKPSFKEYLSLLEYSGFEQDERFQDLPKSHQVALRKQLQNKSKEAAEDLIQHTWEKVSGSKGMSMSRDDSDNDNDDNDDK